VHDTRPIAFQNKTLDPVGHFEYTHVVDLTYIASCERQRKKMMFVKNDKNPNKLFDLWGKNIIFMRNGNLNFRRLNTGLIQILED